MLLEHQMKDTATAAVLVVVGYIIGRPGRSWNGCCDS